VASNRALKLNISKFWYRLHLLASSVQNDDFKIQHKTRDFCIFVCILEEYQNLTSNHKLLFEIGFATETPFVGGFNRLKNSVINKQEDNERLDY